MDATQVWILIGVNSLLLGITGFFIKAWIKDVKQSNDENKDGLHAHRSYTEKEISSIKSELGKRKGETELLRKDLELLASETRKNFEGVNIHMNYQRTTLDEIRKSVEERGKKEVQAISDLVTLLSKNQDKK